MDFLEKVELNDLLQKYPLRLLANRTQEPLRGLNEIHKVKAGDISFVDTPKYYEKVLNSPASYIIVNAEMECPQGKCLLYSNNPFLVYNQIAKNYFPTLHSSDLISPEAQIGENTIIYPNVSIGRNVQIGSDCIIYPNVTIYSNTTIGDNVIIQSNTAVGSEAFYYNKQQGAYIKMHTIGNTVIENDVEIGSNCSIDAGVSGTTRIGRGTKMDNQIHIAHGVEIGENCLLCAQVAIAGKTIIGNNVSIYGKVGISKGLTIGDNAIILASSNVDKNLEGHQRYFGTPAVEARQAMKYHAAARMLPNVLDKIKHLLGDKAVLE